MDDNLKKINTSNVVKEKDANKTLEVELDVTQAQKSLSNLEKLIVNLSKNAIESTVNFSTLSSKLGDFNQDVFEVSGKVQHLNNELTELTEKLAKQKEYVGVGPDYKVLSVSEPIRNVDNYIYFVLGTSVGTSCLMLVAVACHHFGWI